jgi:hypothetical protein
MRVGVGMRVRVRVGMRVGVRVGMRVGVGVRMRVRLIRIRRGRRRHEGVDERAGARDAQARGHQATDQAAAVDVPSQVSLYEFLIRHDAHP